MENKNYFLPLAFLLVLTLAVGMVNGATLQSPSSDSTISGGTVTLNATNDTLIDVLNCTFYAKSSLTANSSFSSIATLTNDTVGDTTINGTFDSTILEDSNNYQFYSQCFNDTDNSTSSTNTGITVDNTVPQTPSSLSPSDGTVNEDGSVTFSATVTGENTTSCTLYFSQGNPGSSSYSMTHSGNSCTKTISSIPEQSYDYYIRASDETNTSDSSTLSFQVDKTTSAGKQYIINQNKKKKVLTTGETGGLGDINPVWIILTILVIIGIIYYFKK